ncbi:MAG: hypothetical protein ACLTDR_07515 [Adlercreutzia equolifaciens]
MCPRAASDGGDGGHGGNVIVVGRRRPVSSLIEVPLQAPLQAERGISTAAAATCDGATRREISC